ncbi:hypothetical protein DPSP01_008119 [Paraphaeosphaeria sporulosa]|uniref:Uncharacterized protein n=1 Tax=Paraphaeosphaeria sporulosa TaxID=1460663 RepID=A0A177C7R1_9PLEO|nr:uncharacterized protein CC84DRAFT_912255 [Paraphaeosphaeria sporulosa]OAG02740.1 hypothetical protein CC84DRAFT_912255 [Paraphaeosphaeria sporulosa]
MSASSEANLRYAQGPHEVELGRQESYRIHRDLIREIIANDHFGGGEEQVPAGTVDQWVAAIEPGSQVPLPLNIKGFYGGSLRASIPIEVARGSYKHIIYETGNKAKVDKYARRMLIALSVLDVDDLAQREPVLGAAALWHVALAQVRLPEFSEALGSTLRRYEAVRPKVNLTDSKMPQAARLKTRLMSVAQELDNEAALATLNSWLRDS